VWFNFVQELERIKGAEACLPDIVIADVNDKESLSKAFSPAKTVLNCTGPYRFLGEAVVEACLDSHCDYLDICGEPQFMESCFLKYNSAAKEKGLKIIHACAFDNVPADLGVLFVSRQVLVKILVRAHSMDYSDFLIV
jgi:short subunit dehydrogenase-like uncharacterized protein